MSEHTCPWVRAPLGRMSKGSPVIKPEERESGICEVPMIYEPASRLEIFTSTVLLNPYNNHGKEGI